MPLYLYRCPKHGVHEVWQEMNDIHEAVCPECLVEMKRVYTSHAVKIKGVITTLGKTRQELFDNLAADGFANKEWREHDSYWKAAKGITD